MKKILLLFLISFAAISCRKLNVVPIEKYYGSKYVITNKHSLGSGNYSIQLKNKDTIFWADILKFDGERLQIGDTLK